MRKFKFEGTCSHCQTTIRSNDSGATWRHLRRQRGAAKHYAMASGTIREI